MLNAFKRVLTWRSWIIHRDELIKGKKYLVCDEYGYTAVCEWNGADFILELCGFDMSQVRESILGSFSANFAEAYAKRKSKQKERVEIDLDELGFDIEESMKESFEHADIDFACPTWFMELPEPPGLEANDSEDIPADVFDNTIGLLQDIERLVMEHEAKRYVQTRPAEE